MNKPIGKILIAIAIIVALTALYRGFVYAPNQALNDENGAGLGVVNSGSLQGGMVASASWESKTPTGFLSPSLA